jgi:type II secretory pathway pseudopilin PulG
MLVVIVVVGILASVAMQSMTTTVQDIRRMQTEREMEVLAKAIVGDPGLRQNNQRSDFGYVGDVGAFPTNLQTLYQNSGGYATWNGPYLPPGYAQDSTGFKTDEWGTLYAYSGGTTISSTGGGSTLTNKITDATDDYLLNTINGTILDAANEPPGADYTDSVDIVISYPNGSGGTFSKTYSPNSTGAFTLDSIPVGSHQLRLIYKPEVDTVSRYLTVLPRHKSSVSYRFASAYFVSGGGGGGGGASGSIEYVAGSTTSGGAHNDHMSFDIGNTSGSPVTINSITATYSTSPASFYGEFKWDGTKLWNDNNDQRGTDEILNFADQVLAAGATITVELKRFREPRNGNTKFDIRNTEFTIVFSNGDTVTFTVPG